jgi:ABC-type polysaccharide/polyol phosphate export permease
MKQKFITFLTGFLIYGLVFGVIMYYTEDNKNILQALFSGLFFGSSMGLYEVFIYPKIRNYFSKKNNKP